MTRLGLSTGSSPARVDDATCGALVDGAPEAEPRILCQDSLRETAALDRAAGPVICKMREVRP